MAYFEPRIYRAVNTGPLRLERRSLEVRYNEILLYKDYNYDQFVNI